MMREYIIKQLRECASVRNKQKTWISELTDDQRYEIFLRLRGNHPAKQIARYVQNKWELLPDSTPHSVSQGILKFKRRIAHLLLHPPPEDTSVTNFTGREDSGSLEGLEAIEHITQLQLKRIRRMVAEEEETGVKHNSLSKEIHALSALLKSLTKVKEWEIAHEGVDPSKRYKEKRERERLQQTWSSFVDEFGPEGRHKMIEAANTLLEEVKKDAITVEVGPDGRLIIPKES